MYSDADISADQLLLAGMRSALDAIDDGLTALTAKRTRLTEQAAKLESNLSIKRVKIAPFRTLLPEICHIIFQYCSWADDAEPDATCLTPSPDTVAPLVLTLVCSRWRTLVINDPSLWTTIHVRPNLGDVLRVDLWLSRSGTMPIDVTICAANIQDRSHSASSSLLFLTSLGHLLAPHSTRMRSFKTHLGPEVLPLVFSPRQSQRSALPMPLLEKLEILLDSHIPSSLTLSPVSAPKLTTLRVRDITPFFSPLVDALPQLESLTIEETKNWKFPNVFPQVLSACTGLQSCTIFFPSTLFYDTIEPINLPNIRYLKLEWPFLFEPALVFSKLTTPLLETLHISHVSHSLILPSNTLTSLCALVESANSLTRLVISGCNLLSPDEATMLLSSATRLSHLEIHKTQRADRFLIPLTPTTTPKGISEGEGDENASARDDFPLSAWLCPKLNRLSVSNLQSNDVVPLINFAKSRLNWESTFPGNISGAEKADEDEVEVKRPFQRGGSLDLSVSESSTSTRPMNTWSVGQEEFSYLSQLDIETHMHDLSRQAALLLLDGFISLHQHIRITGPIGDLFY